MDAKIALYYSIFISLSICAVHTAVLDPALYLYPSPPLMVSDDGENKEHVAGVSTPTELLDATESIQTTTVTSTTDDKESMENAETFWPKFRSVDYTLQRVHIPMTFSLSGNYGGYRESSGVIGTAYSSVGATSLPGYSKLALAGSSYGNFGSPIRLFGGSNGPSWSGWGNGKWGHYGKG